MRATHLTNGAVAALAVVTLVGAAGGAGVLRYQTRRSQQLGLDVAATDQPLHVPLWVAPSEVRHPSRFRCLWDGPGPLAPFRRAERLDAVVEPWTSDEKRARALMHWTRAQFEPGRPDPYPPPDATKTLAEIRAGRTGGFCAQYAFVLIQALQSFGIPARMITIEEHEVVEAWLADQNRWTMLDPLFDLQILDPDGRTLSAADIRDARHSGVKLTVTENNRLGESFHRYVARYDRIAVWIRNAFVSAPENFTDFDRYRVWLIERGETWPSVESLATLHSEGLYEAPVDFPTELKQPLTDKVPSSPGSSVLQ